MRRLPFRARRLAAALGVLILPGCYMLFPSDGGGQAEFTPPRRVEPADVAVPAGYRVAVVATGLTFPTAIAFDGQGRPHVTEAGYAYGPVFTTPRLLRLEPGGETTVIAEGGNPPWNGLAFHQGAFFVSEGGHQGRLVRIDPGGRLTPIVTDLPSFGDHHTNGPVVGPDGWLYFSQGTATNAGVVGLDNWKFGWLERYPRFHDVPGADVTLAGVNYVTDDPFTVDPDDVATTGAYVPFGTPTRPGQVVPGRTKASGSVLRVKPAGGPVEQVAWGFRNPFGLAFSPDGALYVTENGHDVRGSRPVFGAADFLWRVQPGTWYGFPDFVGGEPITDPRFQAPGQHRLRFVLATHPNTPPKPAAALGVHSSSNGFDFSRSARFGHAGHAFIAQFGDMAPEVGKVLAPVGFKVVMADPESGLVRDFAVNRGPRHGPASKLGGGGLERPVSARFSPDGESLYVVDFGVMTVGEHGPAPRPGTGVVWRISKAARP